jgi:hypothetical protein
VPSCDSPDCQHLESFQASLAEGYAPTVPAWALVQQGDPEAIDVFLRREDADQALDECLSDEPEWRELLSIEEVELAGTPPSPN